VGPILSRGGPISQGTLASEVVRVMSAPRDRAINMTIATETWAVDGECSLLDYEQIKEIYERADFPKSPEGEAFNDMHPAGFEQYLSDEWAIERTDVYEDGILPLELLRACQPVRPSEAIKAIGVSQERLIELLQSGRLGKPKKLGHGRVAWRFDEVAAVSEWVKDVRDR
jgi:predicted DNA-binding transcriptional regulator AlpA